MSKKSILKCEKPTTCTIEKHPKMWKPTTCTIQGMKQKVELTTDMQFFNLYNNIVWYITSEHEHFF